MGRMTLYDNSTGSNEEISLDYSVGTFDYIDIYFTGESKSDYSSVRVYNPNSKYVVLQMITPTSATRSYIRRTRVETFGRYITPSLVSTGYIDLNAGTVSHKGGGTNYIYITHVDGWNY